MFSNINKTTNFREFCNELKGNISQFYFSIAPIFFFYFESIPLAVSILWTSRVILSDAHTRESQSNRHRRSAEPTRAMIEKFHAPHSCIKYETYSWARWLTGKARYTTKLNARGRPISPCVQFSTARRSSRSARVTLLPSNFRVTAWPTYARKFAG